MKNEMTEVCEDLIDKIEQFVKTEKLIKEPIVKAFFMGPLGEKIILHETTLRCVMWELPKKLVHEETYRLTEVDSLQSAADQVFLNIQKNFKRPDVPSCYSIGEEQVKKRFAENSYLIVSDSPGDMAARHAAAYLLRHDIPVIVGGVETACVAVEKSVPIVNIPMLINAEPNNRRTRRKNLKQNRKNKKR